MKKKLIIFCLFTFSLFFSQSDNKLFYTEVVNVKDSITAAKLYVNANIWFVDTFKNPKEVLQFSDEKNYTIVGRGIIPYQSNIFMSNVATRGYIYFDLKIMCKNSKFKYEIYNFNHIGNTLNFGDIYKNGINDSNYGPKKWKEKVSNELIDLIENKIEIITSSLKTSMSKSTDDKW